MKCTACDVNCTCFMGMDRTPEYGATHVIDGFYLCPKCDRRYTLDGKRDGYMFHRKYDFRAKEADGKP